MAKLENKEVNVVEQTSEKDFYYRNTTVLENMVKEADLIILEGFEERMLPVAVSREEGAHMRVALVEWLKHINKYRKSRPGVLSLTVEIIDMYVYSLRCKVSGVVVDSRNYQCIGAAAYLMSSKLEEVSPITAKELSEYTSECCSYSNITDMEVVMSFQLEFNFKYVTPVDFIYYLIEFIDLSLLRKKALRDHAVDIYLLVINESNLKKHLCYIIAMNALILGYHQLEDFTDDELREVVKILVDLLNPKKIQLSSCYDYISNIMKTKRTYNDNDDSTDTLQSF